MQLPLVTVVSDDTKAGCVVTLILLLLTLVFIVIRLNTDCYVWSVEWMSGPEQRSSGRAPIDIKDMILALLQTRNIVWMTPEGSDCNHACDASCL